MTTQGRGGKRPGAGRKQEGKTPATTVAISLQADIVHQLDALAKAQGKSRSRVIQEIIQKALQQEQS